MVTATSGEANNTKTATQTLTINVTDVQNPNAFRTVGGSLQTSTDPLHASSVGDINGDSIDDFIIGAPGAQNQAGESSGVSYVIFGKDTGSFDADFDFNTLDGTNGFVINGLAERDKFGSSVSAAGDINGDGIGDVIIGAVDVPTNGPITGASYVIFGKDTTLEGADLFDANFDPGALNGLNGFVINNFDDNQGLGTSVSSAGDVNNDMFDDIVVTSNTGNSGVGVVIFGQPFFEPIVNLADIFDA